MNTIQMTWMVSNLMTFYWRCRHFANHNAIKHRRRWAKKNVFSSSSPTSSFPLKLWSICDAQLLRLNSLRRLIEFQIIPERISIMEFAFVIPASSRIVSFYFYANLKWRVQSDVEAGCIQTIIHVIEKKTGTNSSRFLESNDVISHYRTANRPVDITVHRFESLPTPMLS